MTLTKPISQEQFFPSEMRNNPYKVSSIGPTINDIRKKIQKTMEFVNCDVIEIIVDKKIVAPELLTKDVWEKIWLPKHFKGKGTG